VARTIRVGAASQSALQRIQLFFGGAGAVLQLGVDCHVGHVKTGAHRSGLDMQGL
jgi:D-serine deaminase-like pyridoxal phosphate-dependent protein